MDAIRGAEFAGAGDGPLTTWAGIVHPDDRARVEAEMAEAVAARRPFRCEHRALSSRGDGVRWLLSRGRVASPAAAAADAPRRVLGVAMDITDRKRTEHERDEALALFRGIAETSPDIVYVLELGTGRIRYVNRRVADVLGYGPDELDAGTRGYAPSLLPSRGRGRRGRPPPRARRRSPMARSPPASTGCATGTADWRWLAGRETVFARGGDGAVTRVLGCAHDITEARLAEEAVRRLGGSLLTLQDDERRRIARELHDSTAQVLLGASFATERIRAVSPVLTEDADDAVEEALSLIEEGQREIRTLAYLLHPPLLDEMGLPAALRWYAKGVARRSGLAIAVEVAPELAGRRLPRDVESALFRVAQEALGNACRHSGGTTVQVRMETNAGASPGDACCAVLLAVQDDGRGIAAALAAPAEQGRRSRPLRGRAGRHARTHAPTRRPTDRGAGRSARNHRRGVAPDIPPRFRRGFATVPGLGRRTRLRSEALRCCSASPCELVGTGVLAPRSSSSQGFPGSSPENGGCRLSGPFARVMGRRVLYVRRRRNRLRAAGADHPGLGGVMSAGYPLRRRPCEWMFSTRRTRTFTGPATPSMR